MKISDIRNDTTRLLVSATIDRIVKTETRNFPTLWKDWVKSMIQPTKIEEFIFDEGAGIGAIILTGTIDVYQGEQRSQEQCSVWSVHADGTVRRIYYNCAKARHKIMNLAGQLSSAYRFDLERPYKVSDLRVEDRSLVVTHDDGRTLVISFEEVIAGKGEMREDEEAVRRSHRAPQDGTSFVEAAKQLVERIGPKYGLGYDYASDKHFPEGRDDLCTVRWCAQDGSTDGFDVIYLVWCVSGELRSRELCRGHHHSWAMTREIVVEGDMLVLKIERKGDPSLIEMTIPLADLV